MQNIIQIDPMQLIANINILKAEMDLRFDTVVATLDKMLPGFKDKLQAQVFETRSYILHINLHDQMESPDRNSLENIKGIHNEIEKVKKMARENGVMKAFNQGKKRADIEIERERNEAAKTKR